MIRTAAFIAAAALVAAAPASARHRQPPPPQSSGCGATAAGLVIACSASATVDLNGFYLCVFHGTGSPEGPFTTDPGYASEFQPTAVPGAVDGGDVLYDQQGNAYTLDCGTHAQTGVYLTPSFASTDPAARGNGWYPVGA